ncbi:hypothetical protein BT93_H3295 [Corymbia citriodora subsp. variegata]|nr:hypothetical protein BT93_H3295 [Corymbia citriodora subsp. variegata]
MSGTRQPYPPCVKGGGGGNCTGGRCQWPELVGQNAETAKAVIEKENTYVTVVLLREGKDVGDGNYCINRVYVYIDEKGNVFETPVVG